MAPLPSRPGDLLTEFQLSAEAGSTSVYDAVTRLRPWFLNARDVRAGMIWSRESPAVLVDGAYAGGPDALRTIAVSMVSAVQPGRPVDAVHRYGPYYTTRVILVRMRH